MSERDSTECEHVGSPIGSTILSNSQPQVIAGYPQFYHFQQPRPIYSYNMDHYYPTPPVNQVTDINSLPWEPVTSYSPNIGGLWCSTGVRGLSRVRRPTPLYMAHSHWSPLGQGEDSPIHASQRPSDSYVTKRRESSEQETQIINKPSVIKHVSSLSRSTSTTSQISPKSQAVDDCEEKLQDYKEHPIEYFERPRTEKEECAFTSKDKNDLTIAINIKEEKVDSPVDSPCQSSSSCKQHDYQPTTFEENSPEERMNEPGDMNLLPEMAYSSMHPLHYGTESAFQKPNKPSPSAYPICYGQYSVSAFQKPKKLLPPVYPVCYSQDCESAFQKAPCSMHPLQYDSEREKAFQKFKNPFPSDKSSVPPGDNHNTEQGTSGLSHGSSVSGNATASTSKKSKASKHVCDECGRSFTRSSTLVTHKRIHTGEKPFECEICGRAFRQPGNLSRHRLTHTTSKPYVCPHCSKAFNRASNLHTHMRTHSDYKPYECEFCDKRFHQKVDMKIHRYTHTGEKPHRCPKCGRGFKQLTHLTYHLRTHSDVRMYHCEFCGKGFNQKGNLQAHRYRHTGERPFKCNVCGKGFTLASTRNTHLRTHVTKKPFECQYCDKSFYQKNALKTHYIASHPYTDGVLIL